MEKELLIYNLKLPVQETIATEKRKKKRGLANTMPNFSTKKKEQKFTLQDQVKDPTINSNKTERRIKD